MSKFYIYCTSHRNVNYLDNFHPIVKMVGLGAEQFPEGWIKTNINNELSSKFYSYADLVGQYYLWKNVIPDLDEDSLISISQYRRFWLKSEISNDYPLDKLKDLFLSNIPLEWRDFDVIIPSKFYFKYKLRELLKRLKIFHSVKEQFNNEFNLKSDDMLNEIISFLPKEESSDFYNFLNKRKYLSAHGMFVSNKNIINKYYSVIFPWFEKCEKIMVPTTKKTLDETPRFFQYLNERFLDYWMNKYYKCKVWPIAMYNDQKNIISQIGRL